MTVWQGTLFIPPLLIFFREDEILAAKQILSHHIDTCQPATIQPLLKKRIGENKIDRNIDDLLSIFCVIDENGARGILPVFCAASLSRIPTVPDDMSDLAAVKAELAAVKQQVSILVSRFIHTPEDSGLVQSPRITPRSQDTLSTVSSGIISEQYVSTSYSTAVKSAAKNADVDIAAPVGEPVGGSSVVCADHDDGYQTVKNKRRVRKNNMITG